MAQAWRQIQARCGTEYFRSHFMEAEWAVYFAAAKEDLLVIAIFKVLELILAGP